ncbi:MAG: sulfotransferase family protein [Roseomonas sp.]|nr:sulfotransferase family protein [Roseomonas sp.]
MTKAGDWKLVEAQSAPADRATPDDVRQVFRWILGREATDDASIERHLAASNWDRATLRLRFLRGAEFRRRLQSLDIVPPDHTGAESALIEKTMPSDAPRFIFLHVPKCGGTSVHHHLGEAFSPEVTGPARHNDILAAPALEMGRYRFFSGHYDHRVIDIVPGTRNCVFTVLREPKARLASVYRYLAAHRPGRAAAIGSALADLARAHDFIGFLKAALRVNPAAVDNIYARTFGSVLPVSRWERAAEAGWLDRHGEIGEERWTGIMASASARLASLDHVGRLETLGADLPAILALCGGASPTVIEHLKDISRVTDGVAGFQAPPPAPETNHPLVDHLTRHDRVLYERIRDGRFVPDRSR